ncbi:hypothetical protein AMTRI_Chr01g127840 [Amborella trichopoda]
MAISPPQPLVFFWLFLLFFSLSSGSLWVFSPSSLFSMPPSFFLIFCFSSHLSFTPVLIP